MNIQEYISKVIKLNSIINDCIFCNRQQEEKQAMVDLMKSDIDKRVEIDTWAQVINAISEEYINESVHSFIPESCMNYLIENEIDLIGLSHLNLERKWFIKILDINDSIWEAKLNLHKTMDIKK